MTLGGKEWREHAAIVGGVTLAWNQCVFRLLQVFVHLTGIESPVADAIFFGTLSDSGQRRMIQRVSECVCLDDRYVKSLGALLARIDKASSGRNLAAHTVFGVTAFDPASGAWGPKVVPALDPPQDKRLREDFAAQFAEAEATLWAIANDLEQWVVNTPYPPRSWGHPPLPKALQSAQALHLAEATNFDAPSPVKI
jgi:hypothetical protein